MIGRVIEFTQDSHHLSVYRGFLLVQKKGAEVARLPLSDIGVVLANAHGLSYSNNLLVELAEQKIPLVICGDNHAAKAILWPIESHHLQAARIEAQIAATQPLRKRLWQQVVREKIAWQAALLEHCSINSTPVAALAKKVRSGDPDNIEAQAAQRYWPLLMGKDFRRNREQPGINQLLNYGYTILRAATARAIIASGLHPSLGLHHRNAHDGLRLVDDLMEPFRPLVDLQVIHLIQRGVDSLSVDSKRILVNTLYLDLLSAEGRTPLSQCLFHLSHSLVECYLGNSETLRFPSIEMPLRPEEGRDAERLSDDVDDGDV